MNAFGDSPLLSTYSEGTLSWLAVCANVSSVYLVPAVASRFNPDP